jgi:hypothetical protein
MASSLITVSDWPHRAAELREGACGLIEVSDERLVSVRVRRVARRPSRVEALLWGRLVHRWRDGNRCWLYYRQPRRFPRYLVLDYVISTRGTKLATFRGSLALLEEIARIKGSDALLCDVVTARISHRLLTRWGWAPHAPSRWHRNYIKRFYGQYPGEDPLATRLLAVDDAARPAMQLTLCR